MDSRIKQLLKGAMIYGGGDVTHKLLALLLIPIYTHYLSVSEYGILSILNVSLQLIIFLMLMGLGPASVRYSFGNGQKSESDTFWANTTFLSIVSPIFISLVFWFVGGRLIDRVFPLIPFNPYWALLLLHALLIPIPNLLIRYFQAHEKPAYYVIMNVGRFLLLTGGIIWFVAVQREGVVGKLKGEVFAMSLVWIVSFLLLSRFVRWQLAMIHIKRALSFAIPLIPHFIAWWTIKAASRYCLKIFSDLTQVGLYTLAFQFAGIITTFSLSFNKALNPFFYKIATENPENATKLMGRIGVVYFVSICLLGLVISVFSKEIISLVAATEYQASHLYVPILVSSSVFIAMYEFFLLGILYQKKTKMVPFLTITAATFSIIVNWLFIEVAVLDSLGAAIATSLSSLFILVIFYWQSQKCFKINLKMTKIAMYGSASLGIYLMSLVPIGDSIYSIMAYKSLLIFLWCVGVLFTASFRNSELSIVRELFQRVIKSFLGNATTVVKV